MQYGSEYSSQGYGMQSDQYNSTDYNSNDSSMQMMPTYRCPDYPKPQMYTDNYHAYSNPETNHPSGYGNDSYYKYSSSGYGSKPAGAAMHGGNLSSVMPLSYHKPMNTSERYEREQSFDNGCGRVYKYDERIKMQNPGSAVDVVRRGIENPDN